MARVHTLLALIITKWVADAYVSKAYGLSIFPTINVQPVDNARNEIVDAFLKSDATHLLFLDADTIPPMDLIPHMLAHDLPIVSGLTPIIELNQENGEYWRKWNCVGEDDKNMQPNTGLRMCKGAGGSCIMIRREVFEKMKPPYYRFVYKDDTGKAVTVTEDIYFIINALSLGIKSYADTSIVCQHYKEMLF